MICYVVHASYKMQRIKNLTNFNVAIAKLKSSREKPAVPYKVLSMHVDCSIRVYLVAFRK